MKRNLSNIILTILLLCLTPITALAEDVEIDGIRYELINKGKQAAVISKDTKYLGDIIIPSTIKNEGIVYSVTSIGNNAFQYCYGLTSVDIPNSVTSIGDWAFDQCSSLTSVTIPDGVTNIGIGAFSDCYGLTSVTIPNSVTSIGNYAFSDCSSLTSVTIPNSVTSIGGIVFCGCSSLTSVTIGNGVTRITKSAFNGCSKLTSITIPNSVIYIDSYAFYGCSSLTSVTIPNSVTSIGNYAFYDCSGLTSVTIGNGIRTIYENVFSNCSNLESATILATSVPYTYNNVFDNSYIDYATLMVPDESIAAYSSTEPWSNFGTIKGISGTVVEKEKCATPTSHFADGKLTFECETEGATCYPTVTKPEVVNVSNNEMQLGTTYKVSVYAAKAGYEDSDVATAEINMAQSSSGRKGDMDNDGEINITDALIIIDIILGRY